MRREGLRGQRLEEQRSLLGSRVLGREEPREEPQEEPGQRRAPPRQGEEKFPEQQQGDMLVEAEFSRVTASRV